MNNGGFVRLVDTMPRENLDGAIVEAARVSYASGTTATRTDRGLIRYLMRHSHTTPFEMVEFKFHIKMPIFVARQHMRHRTASINEMSARYSVVPYEYLSFDGYRAQSTTNKQSSLGTVELDESLSRAQDTCSQMAFKVYDDLITSGVCREQARCHLPQSTFTEFIWKINLHNLMHYLKLRIEPGAQQEIREYADEMFKLISPLCPLTMEAFHDFRLEGMHLSRLEIEAIRDGSFKVENPGENREFQTKLDILGLKLSNHT
jgi:thymidylate synthase (FAD)